MKIRKLNRAQDQKSKISSAILKRGQEEKISGRNFPMLSRKSGQEEIAGFAIILVLVSIILLVFLVSYLKKPQTENIQSYEISSFIQSFLQYTTDCEQNSVKIPMQKLISECEEKAECDDGEKTCDVLDSTMADILDEIWKTGEDYPVKGYYMNITAKGKDMFVIDKGTKSSEWKGAFQDIPSANRGYSIYIFFRAYY